MSFLNAIFGNDDEEEKSSGGELLGVVPGQVFTIEYVIGNTWVAIPTGETIDGTVKLADDGTYTLSE